MRRSSQVLLGLAALVVAEVWLLGFVGSQIGVWWLLALLATGAVLGGVLVRHEGGKAWRSLLEARDRPDAMGSRVTDAGLVLVGGILLALPGFLTDAVGLLCLVPVTRPLVRRALGAVLGTITRPYRDQADLLRARLEREQVVEGEAMPGPGEPQRPRPDDPTVIRGEIET